MLGKDGGVIQFGPPLRYSLPVRLVVVPGRDEGFALLAVDPTDTDRPFNALFISLNSKK